MNTHLQKYWRSLGLFGTKTDDHNQQLHVKLCQILLKMIKLAWISFLRTDSSMFIIYSVSDSRMFSLKNSLLGQKFVSYLMFHQLSFSFCTQVP